MLTNVFQAILRFLDTSMEKPLAYGWFHLLFIALSLISAFILCLLWKRGYIKDVRKVVLVTAIIVIIFEIYKQINYTFDYEDGITANYRWYIFPWQFCSTPMYIGLLAGLTKNKMHDNFCAYLATYALFAGLAVMVYPGDVFTRTVGINIQTMVCHGSMITIAIFLYYTGHVKIHKSTLFKALPVFLLCVGVAITLNELSPFARELGIIPEGEVFNMFFFSHFEEGTLPVFSWIQSFIPYPFTLIFYVAGFTAAAGIVLGLLIGIKKFNETDFDARYEAEKLAKEEAKRAESEKEKIELEIADEDTVFNHIIK